MSPDGARSQRIVVIDGAGRAQPQPKLQPPVQPPREVRPPREAFARKRAMQQSGWTTRRLTVAGALGAGAMLLGAITFISRFGVLGGDDSPLLAMGFGLFVIGMVVFCAALIALLATAIRSLAQRNGWTMSAAIVLAPPALIWALHLVGAVGYAVPAVISLVLIGGLVAALK